MEYAFTSKNITPEVFIEGLVAFEKMLDSQKIYSYLLDLTLSEECSYLLLIALININSDNIFSQLIYHSEFMEMSNIIMEGGFVKLKIDQKYFFRTFSKITTFKKFQPPKEY